MILDSSGDQKSYYITLFTDKYESPHGKLQTNKRL